MAVPTLHILALALILLGASTGLFIGNQIAVEDGPKIDEAREPLIMFGVLSLLLTIGLIAAL